MENCSKRLAALILIDSSDITSAVSKESVKIDAGSYIIVTDKSNDKTFLQAKRIYKALYDNFGVGVLVTGVSDAPADKKKIIVGSFDQETLNGLYQEHPGADVIVAYCENGDIVISASSHKNLVTAVDDFISQFIEGKKEMSIEKDYLYVRTDERETLYNGIVLPAEWPPDTVSGTDRSVTEIPYLKSISEGGTHPETVDIDTGRQLFVDDFLIGSSTLERTFHYPDEIYHVSSERWMLSVIYDEEEGLFKMWTARSDVYYCESTDGVNWSEEIVALQAPMRGIYGSVEMNPNSTGKDKYILCIRYNNSHYGETNNPDGTEKGSFDFDLNGLECILYRSPDGRRFYPLTKTGPGGDTSTIFYNPFREKWVFSLKIDNTGVGRARRYYEVNDLSSESLFTASDPVFWLKSDRLDKPDPEIGMTPQLYAFSASAYESIMVGVFRIWYGPNNNTTIVSGKPKKNNYMLGYSRDGFYFDRPDRTPLVAATREEGSWLYGYIQIPTSVCVVVGDEMWFWFSSCAEGEPYKAYIHPHIGYVKLRRDGFASLDGAGTLETVKLRFDSDKKYMFVNASSENLAAEITDGSGKVIEGFSFEDCVSFTGDSTKTRITWKDANDLSFLKNSEFRIRFRQDNGELYSFWLSESENGESGGIVSGGIKE